MVVAKFCLSSVNNFLCLLCSTCERVHKKKLGGSTAGKGELAKRVIPHHKMSCPVYKLGSYLNQGSGIGTGICQCVVSNCVVHIFFNIIIVIRIVIVKNLFNFLNCSYLSLQALLLVFLPIPREGCRAPVSGSVELCCHLGLNHNKPKGSPQSYSACSSPAWIDPGGCPKPGAAPALGVVKPPEVPTASAGPGPSG